MPASTEALWLIEDDADVAQAARLALRGLAPVEAITRPSMALARLVDETPLAILLDLNFERGASDGSEGMRLLDALVQRVPAVPVVVVTAHASLELAVAAVKRGASDFVTKPWDVERLRTTVRAALALAAARREAAGAQLRAAELARDGADALPLLGDSAAMHRVRSLIERVAPTDANVLLLGENGTGKELAARALHRLSARAAMPFVAVDLGAVPETLFESELFGHRKGAFTDARSDRVGRIAAAAGGTLFLDEVGNLPLHLQPKLLTALEQRKVLPVGATQPVAVDVRVVAATNMPRSQLAQAASFRPDLLFRLNTVEIELPPLRERHEDIVPLAQHFARQYARRYAKPERPFSAAALLRLVQDPWPGNVRALRHAVERATILAAGDVLDVDDLALTGGVAHEAGDAAASLGTMPTETSAAPPTATRAASAVAGAADADLNLDRSERVLIERALRLNGWNISLAARDLGLSRGALYRRMERHGL